MTALRFPAGGNLWRTQSYYPWTEPRNGGMLASLKVGLSEGNGERLSRGYVYNSFGDITSLTEGATGNSFTYDGLGRLTSAYGRTYAYDGASRLTSFNGQIYGYGDSGPYHAVDRIEGDDRRRHDDRQPLQLRRAAHCGQARRRPIPPARRPSRQHLADHRRRGGRDSQPHLLRLRC